MPTYRPVPDDRIDDFRGILQYAFRPDEAPTTYDSVEELPGPARLGVRRGMFDGDDLLSTAIHHWFTANVRGSDHPLAGLSGVATPPENRRRGLVASLLHDSLVEYRENGYYLSALWPFEFAFYRRYGWAQAGTTATYGCDPETLSFADASEGRFRQLAPDDFERMNPVLDAAGEGVSLWIRRTEEWWRNGTFEGWDRDPYVYGVEREGDLRGYVVYTVESDDGRTMQVRECNALDHEAYLDLLRFCYYHDPQVERVRIRGRPDTLLFDLVDDPRAVECELTPGGMVRVVDVERALSALDYPADAAGRVVLSVDDPLADWNDGTFALDVEGGEATCTRVDEPIDGDVPITTLSQLVVGHFSVERAALAGGLSVESERTKSLLDDLFPPCEVCLSEGF